MTCKLFFQLLLQNTIYQQADKASGEVSLNAVISFQIDRSRLKFALHYPKTLFNFPASVVDFYDGGRVVLQVGADPIKTTLEYFLPFSRTDLVT